MGKDPQDWKRWEGARDLERHLRLLEDPGGVIWRGVLKALLLLWGTKRSLQVERGLWQLR